MTLSIPISRDAGVGPGFSAEQKLPEIVMTSIDYSGSRRREPSAPHLLPPLTPATAITLLLAGLVATGVWEVWARGVTPLLIGGPLEPAGLIKSSFGISSSFLAETIHIATGLIIYPLGYLFVAQPIARLLPVEFPWSLTGAGFGIGLWIFAMYVMAHLVAGFPAFLGFGDLAFASFFGHLLYGLAVAGIVALRRA